MRTAILIAVFTTSAAAAELVDCVAATVDRQVITLGRIIIENRLAAFQEGRQPDQSPEARRRTAERLVDRRLLLREIEISGFPQAVRVDAMAALDELKKRWTNADEYEAALSRYEIREEELLDFLQTQLTVLRFLQVRFRAESEVTEAEIERYYEEKFAPEVRARTGTAAPPLNAVRREIEAILSAEAADRAISRWLDHARSRARIEYREAAFQ
jgi:hypothetical protein